MIFSQVERFCAFYSNVHLFWNNSISSISEERWKHFFLFSTSQSCMQNLSKICDIVNILFPNLKRCQGTNKVHYEKPRAIISMKRFMPVPNATRFIKTLTLYDNLMIILTVIVHCVQCLFNNTVSINIQPIIEHLWRNFRTMNYSTRCLA